MKKRIYTLSLLMIMMIASIFTLTSKSYAVSVNGVEIKKGNGDFHEVYYDGSRDHIAGDDLDIKLKELGYITYAKDFYVELKIYRSNELVYDESIYIKDLFETTEKIGYLSFSIVGDDQLQIVAQTYDDEFTEYYSLAPYTLRDNGDTYRMRLYGLVENDEPSDTTPPVINPGQNLVTSIENPKPLSYFLKYVTATDETDGDVEVYVKRDNYTSNMNKVGRHEVLLGAKDKSGNEAEKRIYISVVDNIAPVIVGTPTIVKIGYKDTWSIANFKTTLTVSDNYDTNLTHTNIYVKTDNYTSNRNKIGIHSIVFGVKDSSGNEGIFTKQIQVIDNVAPVFVGPKEITTSNTQILTESQVRAELTATDEIDGVLTSSIKLVSDNFTGNGSKVGKYTLVYEVTDKAGNTATHTVTIDRKDNLPPVFWIKEGVSIYVEKDIKLTKEQIVQLLTATGQLNVNAATNVSFTYNEYFGNETTSGEYAVRLLARSTDGTESVHNLKINVMADEKTDDDVNLTPNKFWDKYQNYVYGIGAVIALITIGAVLNRKKK